jgi:predicted NUDIX family NTP pyrophosphohydrolase
MIAPGPEHPVRHEPASQIERAMPLHSAGILPVRLVEAGLEFFLVHPGGPFFRKKDDGVWSIPKGLVTTGEDALAAAQRELCEETGFPLPAGPYLSLGRIIQSRKVVEAWVVAANFDPDGLVSNEFELEWPPGGGRRVSFPEVDRAGWFCRRDAERKLLGAQHPLLDRAEVLQNSLFS